MATIAQLTTEYKALTRRAVAATPTTWRAAVGDATGLARELRPGSHNLMFRADGAADVQLVGRGNAWLTLGKVVPAAAWHDGLTAAQAEVISTEHTEEERQRAEQAGSLVAMICGPHYQSKIHYTGGEWRSKARRR